jgi:hypothetical protein
VLSGAIAWTMTVIASSRRVGEQGCVRGRTMRQSAVARALLSKYVMVHLGCQCYNSEVNVNASKVDVSELSKGDRFELRKVTPLMPSHSPRNPLKALAKMYELPIGTPVAVRRVKNKSVGCWYLVDIESVGVVFKRAGWINSVALLGQGITLVEG